MGYTGQSDLGRPQAPKFVEEDRGEQQLEARGGWEAARRETLEVSDLEPRTRAARRATPATGGSRLQLG